PHYTHTFNRGEPMTTPPLSFCEVLEQEYEYFFGEKPSYDQIKFNKKQIREMGDLLQRLKLVREHKGRSRWHFLARCIDKTKSEKADPQQAVVDGLNCWLT